MCHSPVGESVPFFTKEILVDENDKKVGKYTLKYYTNPNWFKNPES